jgi:tripartite-type tricarboxylate transporter receptor subunit TctC
MLWRILIGPLVSLLVTAAALARDSYPSRPVRLIVGLEAGSSTDVTARTLRKLRRFVLNNACRPII